MRSPCHECEIHLAGGDKNGHECLVCGKRVEYVAAIGGMYHGVPIEESDMAGKRWTDEEDIEIMRTMGEPAADVAKKLGRALGSIYTRRSELKGQLKADPGTRLELPPQRIEAAPGLSIDLGGYPDVYDMLCNRAAVEMRTVNAQAAWMLKCALQGGAIDHGRAPHQAP